MANASQYGDVAQFWSGMSDLLGSARGISLADFDAAMNDALNGQGISGADATADELEQGQVDGPDTESPE